MPQCCPRALIFYHLGGRAADQKSKKNIVYRGGGGAGGNYRSQRMIWDHVMAHRHRHTIFTTTSCPSFGSHLVAVSLAYWSSCRRRGISSYRPAEKKRGLNGIFNLLYSYIRSYLQDLEWAHQRFINRHHGSCVVEFSAIIGRWKQRDELSLGEKLVAIFHYLMGATN